MSQLQSSSRCLRCETATYWEKYVINIPELEIGQSVPSTTGEWLKYHRNKKGLSQKELSTILGIKHREYIKLIESNNKIPSRELSEKLSDYFNLNTKYFYDDTYENTPDVKYLLKSYRTSNNLSIRKAADMLNINPKTWSNWENGKTDIRRDKYQIMKELRIIP